jgi:hypothetical protein
MSQLRVVVVGPEALAPGTQEAGEALRAREEREREPLHPDAGKNGIDWRGMRVDPSLGGDRALLHRTAGKSGVGMDGRLLQLAPFATGERVRAGPSSSSAITRGESFLRPFGATSADDAGMSGTLSRELFEANRATPGGKAAPGSILGAGGTSSLLRIHDPLHASGKSAAASGQVLALPKWLPGLPPTAPGALPFASTLSSASAGHLDSMSVAHLTSSLVGRSLSSSGDATAAMQDVPFTAAVVRGVGRESSMCDAPDPVVETDCPHMEHTSPDQAWLVTLQVPVKDFAASHPGWPLGAASPSSSSSGALRSAEPLAPHQVNEQSCASGRIQVHVRFDPARHTTVDIVKAALVRAGQARLESTDVYRRFHLVLPPLPRLQDARLYDKLLGPSSHPHEPLDVPLASLRYREAASPLRDTVQVLQETVESRMAAHHHDTLEVSEATSPLALRLALSLRHRSILSLKLASDAFESLPPPVPHCVRLGTYNLLAPCKFIPSDPASFDPDTPESGYPGGIWKNRMLLQSAMLGALECDILCLQELWFNAAAHKCITQYLGDFKAIVAETRPSGDDQVLIMARKPESLPSDSTRPRIIPVCRPGTQHMITRKVKESQAVCAMALFYVVPGELSRPSDDTEEALAAAAEAAGAFQMLVAVTHLKFVSPSAKGVHLERARQERVDQARAFKRAVLDFATELSLDASRGDLVVFAGDLNMEDGPSRLEDGRTHGPLMDSVWRMFAHSEPEATASNPYAGSFVSAVGAYQAYQRLYMHHPPVFTPSGVDDEDWRGGPGAFVSHVTREGGQRSADFVMLGVPTAGAVYSSSRRSAIVEQSPIGKCAHPSNRIVHAALVPQPVLPRAILPYPTVGGLSNLSRDTVSRLCDDARNLPEGVWLELSDHRPVCCDIAPPRLPGTVE